MQSGVGAPLGPISVLNLIDCQDWNALYNSSLSFDSQRIRSRDHRGNDSPEFLQVL